jgi:hypothetical protein
MSDGDIRNHDQARSLGFKLVTHQKVIAQADIRILKILDHGP